MLETMRNASKGWVAGIMIIVLAGSFAVWGVQDMLNLTTRPTIATIGHEEVTQEEMQREFTRFLRQMAQQTGAEMPSQQAKQLGLDREALDQLVNKKAMYQKARDLGFNITTSQVIDGLKTIRGLSDGAGGLDPRALQQLMQQNQMTENELIETVRGDILREQLVRTLIQGIRLPVGLDMALNRFRQERRIADYVLVDPSRAGEIKDADDATLRKFYDAHAKERYAIPELRAVTVVTARPSDVESQLQVTEDDIKKRYAARRSTYETPEKRTLEQIKFKSEAAARAAKTKLDAGTSFDDVAKAEGLKPEDIKLGDVNKGAPGTPAEAFTTELDKATDPIKGPFGWVILRATSITPGTIKTLEEVQEDIRKELVAERSKDKLFDLTNEFEDTRGGGATLEEAAAKHKLPVTKVASVDVRGNDANGQTVDGLPGGDFLPRVFIAEQGVDSELLEGADGSYFEFRVDRVTPASTKPFDQVKAQVLADWRAEELEKRLVATADALVKRGNAGESIQAIASSLGVAPLKTDPLPRYGQNAIFGTETLQKLADTSIGKFVTGPVADGKSRIVARLSDIQYVTGENEALERETYSQRLREAFASDVLAQFSNSARADAGVTINEERFKAFHEGE